MQDYLCQGARIICQVAKEVFGAGRSWSSWTKRITQKELQAEAELKKSSKGMEDWKSLPLFV